MSIISPAGSPYPVSPVTYTNVLYGFNNVTITSGAASTNSPTGSALIDVSNYSVKTAYAYLFSTTNCSGSFIISGSFDGTNLFQIRSGSFNSGSLIWFTIRDVVPKISLHLYNSWTGSAVSGSMYLACQS